MRLVITSVALSDLEQIGNGIAVHNPLRAVSFVEELEARCSALPAMPLAYPLVSRKKGCGVRRIVHGNDLIFYRADPDAVVVLHVLAARMNVDEILRLSE
jgi:toxin ParE1/3/4